MTISVLTQTPGYIVEFEVGSGQGNLEQIIEEMQGQARILEVRGPHIADTLHAAKHRYFKEDLEPFNIRVVVFIHRDGAKLFSFKMDGLGCVIDFSSIFLRETPGFNHGEG
jgi:hypothetical protein